MSDLTPVTLVDESSTQLTSVVKSAGLELESAQPVLDTFTPLLRQAEEWRQKVSALKVTDVSQKAEMALARASRLALKDIRVNAEKARKRLKEESLRRGKAIDGAYNIVEFIIAPLEQSLLEQENFVKNKELERRTKLKAERVEALTPFVQSPADLAGFLFEEMAEETFQSLLSSHRLAHETRREAALKAEAERIAREQAEAVERERIRAENERLRREAAEKEAALQAERERVAREQAEAAEFARKERAAIEAKAAEERRAAEEVARKERLRLQELAEVARQKAEAEKAELKRKADEAAAAERKLREEQEQREADEKKAQQAERERQRQAELAPDREKLHAFSRLVRGLPVPALTSPDVAPQIAQALSEVADYIDGLAESI